MEVTPDSKDRQILNHLQQNGRISSAELASLVGLSPSGVQKRMRKLEENGVIQKYTTLVNRRSFGYDLVVFVQVTLQGHTPEQVAHFDQAMQEMAEVLECHRIIGAADYLLKIIVTDHEHLDDFLMKQLLPLPAVARVNSNLVLKAVKETTDIGLT
ncbi:MAG: Lrp/AsnC family transcriptional regulator [Chloroflexota bacterium]